MNTTTNTPVLPYAGTSGWSGSDASRERAEEQDANGTTSMLQATVLRALSDAGRYGRTWRELDTELDWNHHGRTTGALSNLHKAGLICRLKVKRNRCSIYVLPEHTGDRETAAHGRKGNGPSITEMQSENRRLRKQVADVENLVAVRVRSYSYSRDDLLADIRRALL